MARSIREELDFELSRRKYIIGCDEVGTGAIAGPVVVTAVVYPSNWLGFEGLKDSKKYSNRATRKKHAEIIFETALTFSQVYISNIEIDKGGLRTSLIKGVVQVVNNCREQFPDSVAVIDGNMHLPIAHISLPKADDLIPAVSAASVLGKVERDYHMNDLHVGLTDNYHFNFNRGYGTWEHLKAIKELGLSVYHRKSFQLKTKYLEKDAFIRDIHKLTEEEKELRLLRRNTTRLKNIVTRLLAARHKKENGSDS